MRPSIHLVIVLVFEGGERSSLLSPGGQLETRSKETRMNLIAKRRKWAVGPIAALILLLTAGASQGTAQTKQPNILVIMDVAIRIWNHPACLRELMAGKTPNL